MTDDGILGPPAPLDEESLLRFVRHEAMAWRATAGPPRMRGPVARGELVPYRSFGAILELVDDGLCPASGVVRSLVDGALETGSIWYAAGAEDAAWRRWFGLAALGHLLAGDVEDVCWSAVLGGETQLLRRLPPGPLPTLQPASVALWNLLGGIPPAESGPPADHHDEACALLQASIPARDHATTGFALGEIADFWIGEVDDWDLFRPGYEIQFQVAEPALAALAVASGFDPGGLTSDQRALLGPGLAVEFPAPLLGRVVTHPTGATA